VLDGGDADALAQAAAQEGMRTLRQAAHDKIRAGVTSLEEMWSITLDAEFGSSAADAGSA